MQPWRTVRAGLQLVFFAWLVNACWGLLHGITFNAIVQTAMSGGDPATWKMLDRVALFAGFADLAATLVAALGMLMVARAPAQTGAGGLATGAFACLIGSLAFSLYSFVEQLLQTVKVMNDPFLGWSVARYLYMVEALAFLVAIILFLVAALKIAAALRGPAPTWQGIIAVVAIPCATLLASLPMWIPSLGRFRFEHRWLWFVITRGIRGLGDVMLLLFLAYLGRAAVAAYSTSISPRFSGSERS
jgi:hypothetical protein